jgi:hypothetical protein
VFLLQQCQRARVLEIEAPIRNVQCILQVFSEILVQRETVLLNTSAFIAPRGLGFGFGENLLAQLPSELIKTKIDFRLDFVKQESASQCMERAMCCVVVYTERVENKSSCDESPVANEIKLNQIAIRRL